MQPKLPWKPGTKTRHECHCIDYTQESAKGQVFDLRFRPVWHVHADTGSSHSSGRTMAPVDQRVQACLGWLRGAHDHHFPPPNTS